MVDGVVHRLTPHTERLIAVGQAGTNAVPDVANVFLCDTVLRRVTSATSLMHGAGFLHEVTEFFIDILGPLVGPEDFAGVTTQLLYNNVSQTVNRLRLTLERSAPHPVGVSVEDDIPDGSTTGCLHWLRSSVVTPQPLPEVLGFTLPTSDAAVW